MRILNLIIFLFILVLSACEGIKLTVESGSGSGTYASKAKVPIKAYMPNPGFEFEKWEGDTQYIDDIANKETLILLPELSAKETLELKVKAIYEVDSSAKEYNLIVEEGSGSGSYLTYSSVTITANTPPNGYQFDKWVGDVQYVYNPKLSQIKIIIQKEDIILKATYKKKIVPIPVPTPTPTPVPTLPPPIEGPIKLMPIGDSITHGSARFGDVRCKLWFKLKAMNLSFDFVGGMRGKLDNTSNPACDENHQAQSGARADYILGLIEGSAAHYRPDMVIIHLGTNDIRQGQSAASTVGEISQIIDKLRLHNSNVVVFLAAIIPNYQSETNALNAGILQLTNTKTTLSSPVIFVDQFSGFGLSDQIDALHPNDTGAEKMATKWAEAIVDYLK